MRRRTFTAAAAATALAPVSARALTPPAETPARGGTPYGTGTSGAGASSGDTPPSPLEKPGYELDFSEEFDGTELDTSVWSPHYLPHFVEPEDFDRTAARYELSDGTITLRVEQDQAPWNPDQDGTVVSSAIQTFNTPGWHVFNDRAEVRNPDLPTFDGYTTRYGYFEVRAKLSDVGGGGHQALWLVGTDVSTSAQPEIDFIETFFSTPQVWRIAAFGWGDPDFLDSWYSTEAPVTGTPTEEFHLYAMEWTPWDLNFYYDGKHIATINDAPTQEMGIIMNVYTGAGSGAPNDVWPKGWEVDYLRVWKPIGGYDEEVSTTWSTLTNRERAGRLTVGEDGTVRFGDASAADPAAQWRLAEGRGDHVRVVNRKTSRSLGVDPSGRICLLSGGAETPSLQWSRTAVDGDHFRLTSAVTGGTAHVENATGGLELGEAGPGWWSAQWRLDAAPKG